MKTAADQPSTLTLTSSDGIRWWGNVGHIATLVSTVVFTAFVVAFVNDDDDAVDENKQTIFFDTEWKKKGFCVTNTETPVVSSHAVCLYVDVALALVMAVLHGRYRHRDELKHANLLISTNIFGTIGHGIAHGILAYAMQMRLGKSTATLVDHDTTTEQHVRTTAIIFHWCVFLICFWLPLMKAAMPNAHTAIVGVAALFASRVVSSMPENMGFTAVQTILMLAFSLNQLLRPAVEKRDLHYSLYAWIVSFPLTLVGWMESTQCSAFVKKTLYGHVVYDAYIPLAIIAFYTVCLYDANQHLKMRKSA